MTGTLQRSRKSFNIYPDAALCHITNARSHAAGLDIHSLGRMSSAVKKTWQAMRLRYNVRATAPRNGPVM
jgi:hypothetical protein